MEVTVSVCHFPVQAFTVVAVFNSMTFALKVTPLAVRSLSEGAVAVQRFQVRNTGKPEILILSHQLFYQLKPYRTFTP